MDLDTRPPSRCPPNLHFNARRGVHLGAADRVFVPDPAVGSNLANTLRLAHLRWPTLTHSDIELAALLARAWLTNARTWAQAFVKLAGGRRPRRSRRGRGALPQRRSVMARRMGASGARSSSSTTPCRSATPSLRKRASRSTFMDVEPSSHTALPAPSFPPLGPQPRARAATASAPRCFPLCDHGAERILEPEKVPGALADLDVGQQPEQGAAPVGPAPGVRPIEALVASPRQTLREAAHEVAQTFSALNSPARARVIGST